MKKILISLGISCLLLNQILMAQNIIQKPKLGVQLAQAPPETGAIYGIQQVLPNSTAASIQLKVGDVLLSINEQEITEPNILFGTLGSFQLGDEIRLEILRGTEKLILSGKMQATDLQPHSENAEIILEEVPFREGFIRAYVNKPKGEGPFKTIYFLQGYTCQSINWQNPNLPFVQLLHHWVDLGYAVVRVEKPGTGEFVNCSPCESLTFEDEIESFSNGYQKILDLSYLDNENIILYGHSLGGNVAPILASKFSPRGVMVYGTVLKSWEEYLVDLVRHQQALMGRDIAQTEADLRVIRKCLFEMFTNEKNPSDLNLTNEEKHILSDLLGLDLSNQMVGRSLDFWRKLNAYNYVEQWKNVQAPVLSMYGESDVEALNELNMKRIAEVVNYYHPEQATFALIPETDHALAKINNQKENLSSKMTGQYSSFLLQGISSNYLEVVDNWLQNLENTSFEKNDQLSFYQNNSYTNLISFTTLIKSMDVEAGDLDKDGDLDIVLAGEGQANVILFNDGEGKFLQEKILKTKYQAQKPKHTGEDSEDIALADFDQDGDLDIIFASEDTPHHELLWNDGVGEFTPAEYDFPKNVPANALAVWDVNGDDFPDVLFGNLGQNELYLNQGDGTFALDNTGIFPENMDHTQDLKLVDIDQDGDWDLVEGAEKGGSNLYIFENGKFTEKSEVFPDLTKYECRKVVLADINADGREDIFFCHVAWNPMMNPQNLLFLNEGNLQFTDVTEEYLEKDNLITLDTAFLDLNQDEKLDLLTANGFEMDNLKVYLREGNRFVKTEHFWESDNNGTAISLKVADWNQDGKEDIYVGNTDGSDLLYFGKTIQTN